MIKIAIDGPSGAGKSTLAKRIAKELATMSCVTGTSTHFVLRRYKELDVELIKTEEDDRGAYSL